MYEMSDFAQQEEGTNGTASTVVSFPDHYLIPYIQRCKKSKYIRCGCSILFFGTAIFCFIATNEMIYYPVTKSKKIAFIYAGIFCLLAAVCCLRFTIRNYFIYGSENTAQFEIARRDTESSDGRSFSGHFVLQEAPVCQGTPKEGSSPTETPEEFSSLTRSLDEPCRVDISTFRYDGRVPRHSISDGLSTDFPLLQTRRPEEDFSRSSRVQNRMDSRPLQNGRTNPGYDNYPPNYSTFDNCCEASETEPLLLDEASFQKSCDISETASSLAESSFQNSCNTSETIPLMTQSSLENSCDGSETVPSLAESSFDYGCDASETVQSMAESNFKNNSDGSETVPSMTEWSFENHCEGSETVPSIEE